MATQLWQVSFWYPSGIETRKNLTRDQADDLFYGPKPRNEKGEYPEHIEIDQMEGGQQWR